MTTADLLTGVLVREGWPAYTDDPADHGGPTKGGITLADLTRWRGHPCTADDVRLLEEPEVRALYTHEYVVGPKFDQITDPWVQAFIVDTGILQGPREGAQVLQRALDVPADGDVGPVTLASLDLALHRPAELHRALIRQRLHCLLDDMVADIPVPVRQTTNLKYRHGWANRVLDFL